MNHFLKESRRKRGKAPGETTVIEPTPAPRPRRRWAFRLLALAIVPLMLVVVELALRVGGYGFPTGFFKPLKIGNEGYLVQNEEFGLRFFPREISRKPEPILMKAIKPPGKFRIFIFGESAALGDPEPAYGAGRYLEVLLRERFPSAPSLRSSVI